jgi:glycosyltransferase involved in cell wall biosynthesis
LNEEHHLPDAIRNVKPWASDIFIVDSCSTDQTVSIALQHNVGIVQRRFTNFGDQWNFALKKLPISTRWTLKLDPDERITPGLIEEMRRVTEAPNSPDGYWMPRRLWFMGKPLHVVANVLRLWKTGTCRFSDVLVNEHPIIDGTVGCLKGIIEHHDSPDLHKWCEKQNQYTTMEAIMRVRNAVLAVKPRLMGTQLERRMFLKKHFHRIPFRFNLLWLYLMLFMGVWRDGEVGRAWAHMRVEIMRIREFKVKEMNWTGRISVVPQAPHGDFDPRVTSLPLQEMVCQFNGGK